MNLTASGGDVASEANVTDIHEALNFARNEEVCGTLNPTTPSIVTNDCEALGSHAPRMCATLVSPASPTP